MPGGGGKPPRPSVSLGAPAPCLQVSTAMGPGCGGGVCERVDVINHAWCVLGVGATILPACAILEPTASSGLLGGTVRGNLEMLPTLDNNLV